MSAHFGYIAWFVYTYGACGNTGLRKVEKEENVPVMAVCIIR
jgi:hypothetical protein